MFEENSSLIHVQLRERKLKPLAAFHILVLSQGLWHPLVVFLFLKLFTIFQPFLFFIQYLRRPPV